MKIVLKILLIEDDFTLCQEIKERLSTWNYDVHTVEDFNQVMERFTDVNPDLVIIDIQLPQFDGFHWCRMIRSHSKVPIIFLSSRDHPTDMVMSMQLGADDYIQKPFHFDVLIAKIQAILRRVYNYNAETNHMKTWHGATIDFERNTIETNEHSIELTKNEAFILHALLSKKNKIVSRDQLIEMLWKDSRFISDNTLTVNVNRLRYKLESIALDRFIETKVGQGYMALGEENDCV